MTTIKDVEKALLTMNTHELARKWIHNDIIKMKIAQGYDAWINDIHDHKLFLTLIEYIETRLDTPEYFEQ